MRLALCVRVLAASLLLVLAAAPRAHAQAVTIPRIEAMPALPPTYELRDWKRVARQYDSLAFDPARTGPYLPLVRPYGGTVNYPEHQSFALPSYVGGGTATEAVAALPALVGASLVGVNKRAQFGRDWVLFAEEWFNRANGENVYLNNPQDRSGSDGWYDTMPNVFFYQLADLYPGAGHFDAQFRTVADRWLQAVQALGGATTPYRAPDFNVRAIALRTMVPNRSGVREPEMAGAVAWLLYCAYVRTGDARYRVGAEQALDFLDGLASNPSYELQLPYGALAAARMNAEVGTHYDVPKLVGWSFERGPLRAWGTFVGARGGVDLSGLVGEVDGDGYLFLLNGLQQAAALVPLVRYDDRLARSIGRWMVNLASATRLFYWNGLPAANQNAPSYAWASANDPNAVMGYEALRGQQNGLAPFATGDAVRNGWAATDLSLYSSSSIGYLGALVDSTEVPGVLRLDLLKTDFYHRDAYASFLYYNPYAEEKTVTLKLNFGRYDLYDAAHDAFVARGVSGTASLPLPPDDARVIVVVPAGATEERQEGRLLLAGIVADYRVAAGNRAPRVKSLDATGTSLGLGEPATLYCTGDDPDAEAVTVTWNASGGTLTPNGGAATFAATTPGTYTATCHVRDGAGVEAGASLTLTVLANRSPLLTSVIATPKVVDVGEQSTLTCAATDPDNDPLTYTWTASTGTLSGTGANITFTAPTRVGVVPIVCRALDPSGGEARDTAFVTVGRLVLDLPLDATLLYDRSGFEYGGTLAGPELAVGRTGTPGSALAFDGLDDVATIPAAGRRALQMTDALTVSVWIRPAPGSGDRERYVVSHGSYQNRYKLSLLPQSTPATVLPRWTLRTSAGITDLDAAQGLPVGMFSHVVATYDGASVRLYVNGALSASKAFTGTLLPSDLPLLLGQMLPTDNGYNFAGVLDDVRLYNRALTAAEVGTLYATAAEAAPAGTALTLGLPAPNPARGPIHVAVMLPAPTNATLAVFDALGRRVATLHDGPLSAGTATFTWEGRGASSGVYVVRLTADGRTLQQPVVRLR